MLLAYYLVAQKPIYTIPTFERILRPSRSMNYVDEKTKDLIYQIGNFFVIENKSDNIENDYNRLYFDFKNKSIVNGEVLLERVKQRTTSLLEYLFEFLSNKC